MAKLELRQVWINLLSTGAAVHAYSSDRGRGTSVDGEVRKFAGGRLRGISSEGQRGQFTFKLRDVTNDDIETLKSWYGRPVIVRDHRGRRYFGLYFSVDENERKAIDLWDVTLTVQEITYVEGS
jgi:hypothetical protein